VSITYLLRADLLDLGGLNAQANIVKVHLWATTANLKNVKIGHHSKPLHIGNAQHVQKIKILYQVS
jgi:hypothetical protein